MAFLAESGARASSSITAIKASSTCHSATRNELMPAVGSIGDSYDNALAETIIGLFNTEVIDRRVFRGGAGHLGLGVLVQPQATDGSDRTHPARGNRSQLIGAIQLTSLLPTGTDPEGNSHAFWPMAIIATRGYFCCRPAAKSSIRHHAGRTKRDQAEAATNLCAMPADKRPLVARSNVCLSCG